MQIQTNGFNSLDFDEAKRIAEMVNFDVMQYAKKLRSCGPGCDYFSKDKKYFITMLLKHIDSLLQKSPPAKTFAREVLEWYQSAKAAEQEQQKMDKQYIRIRLGRGKS
jgi:type II secretory pathway component PulK